VKQTRLFRIKQVLKNGPITHFFFSDTIDAEYLSGFRSSNAFCLVSQTRNLLCSDFRYKEAAVLFCRKNPHWKFIEIRENDISKLSTYIPAKSIVAYQSDVVTVDQFGNLKKKLGKNIRFVKMPLSAKTALLPKEDIEIGYMRKAANAADKAFATLLRSMQLGMTEKQAALMLEKFCKKNGSEKPSFDTIVLFGKRAALPHGVPSDVRLKTGDWVLCDFGCTIRGYCSDMTRTFVFGKASARQKEIYDVVLRAQRVGKDAVKEQALACDVDKACREIIVKAGYGKLFGHATGHGVGLRIHEKPRISKTDKTILEQGDVITIEPGIYESAFGGVRIEDMVVVTKTGCDVLTQSDRDLIEVGS
jgi:Xaa-Pro aminopeptidase